MSEPRGPRVHVPVTTPVDPGRAPDDPAADVEVADPSAPPGPVTTTPGLPANLSLFLQFFGLDAAAPNGQFNVSNGCEIPFSNF